ncbi:hypothetical protein HHI36_001603 [Cryptolaemus montrouzieri]|uniref:Uncharacterized protein n=1 Tax=Cryptolaemus montrouzieri TaxID=559131 RepID=A0ABD2P7Z2_9CUCU
MHTKGTCNSESLPIQPIGIATPNVKMQITVELSFKKNEMLEKNIKNIVIGTGGNPANSVMTIEKRNTFQCAPKKAMIHLGRVSLDTTSETILNHVKRTFSKDDFMNSDDSIHLAGDFNLDFSRNSPEKTKVMELFESFGLYKVFEDPSRITSTSATCIDNFFTNIDISSSPKSTLNPQVSDHMAQKFADPL